MNEFLYVLRATRDAMLTEGATEREREIIGRHFGDLEPLAELHLFRVAVHAAAWTPTE